MFDILVAGEINPDLILTGDVLPEFGQVEKLVEGASLQVGSSSAIFACGAARLGLRVAFIGVCGGDVWGRFMLEALAERGVDVSHVIVREGGHTGLSVILNRGSDRAILTYVGLGEALRAADVPDELLGGARHLHVASYFLQKGLQAGLPGLFRRAHARGATTSLDPNFDPSAQWRGFDELLSVTDVFLPNATEALSLSGEQQVEAAARRLARQCPIAAVKLGADGALLCQGELVLRERALAVQVVDTVGAGDAFDAGFLYGRLQGWPLEKSLRLACVCGSLSTRQQGGTEAQPTLQEAMRHAAG